MTGTLIELDVSEPWQPPERAPGRRLPSRWLVGPLVIVAMLVGISGGAAAQPLDAVLEIDRAGGSQLAFGPDRVYTFNYGSTALFEAYPLGATEPMWKIDLEGEVAVPQAVDGDLLVLNVFDPQAVGGQYREDTTQVRDARTGRLLWRRTDGGVLAVTDDLVIMAARRDAWFGDLQPGEERPERTMYAYDRRTGEPRWTRTVARGTSWARRYGWQYDTTGPVIEIDAAGRLRVSDLVTDAERFNVQLDVVGPVAGLELWGDVAVVRQFRPGDRTVPIELPAPPGSVIYRQFPQILSGYDLATGQRRWRFEDEGYLTPCGDAYLCEFSRLPPTIIDPLTGAVVFRSGGVGDVGYTVRGDRVISSPEVTTGGSGGVAVLSDLRTGKEIRSFGPWTVVGEDPDRGVLVAHDGGRGVLVVAVLDLDTGDVSVIGRARNWSGRATCEWADRYVGCSGQDGFRMWRVPAEVVDRAARE